MSKIVRLWFLLLLSPLFTSCFNLDEELYDRIEKENYYTDYTSLMAALLRPYAPAQLSTQVYTFWLQELAADQLVNTQKSEHWQDGGKWRMLHQHTWDPYEENCQQLWNACYGGIGYCNNVLADISTLDYAAFGLSEELRTQHIAELKTLCAYYQLQLFDLFHTPPISTSNYKEVGNASPKENFRFIEESLKEALPALPKAPCKQYEGRLTQGAAATLLMRLYFNASWYIDEPMWRETRAVCEQLLQGAYGTYALATDWTQIWNVGNGDCPALIWSYPQSKQFTYAEFYYLNFMHYTAPEQFGCGTDLPDGYNGCHLTPSYDPAGHPYQTALGCPFAKFAENDCRKRNFQVTAPGEYEGLFLFGPQYSYAANTLLVGTEEWGGQPLCFVDQVAHYSYVLTEAERRQLIERQMAGSHPWRIEEERFASLSSNVTTGEENSGVRLVKYPIYPSDDAAFMANDFVVLRLSEVYYTLAECCFRLGEVAEAEHWLNQVRQRYFSAEDWAEARYPETGAQLTEQELLDEWGREFLGESRRRTDLNRFDRLTKGSWWDKQPSESYRRFYPIPAQAIRANPLLERSVGYTY